MGWTSPTGFRFVDGDPITSAQMNTLFRDNLLASCIGVASTAGRYITTNGKFELAERQAVRAFKPNTVTIDSEWPADPEGEDEIGPVATIEHSGSFFAWYGSRMRRLSGDGVMNYAPVPEGAGDDLSVYSMAARTSRTVGTYDYITAHMLFTGYKPGTTTVTMKYGRNSGDNATGDYASRRMILIPL